ncbi:MAG: ComF family protein [Pseudomonadota bacterium]
MQTPARLVHGLALVARAAGNFLVPPVCVACHEPTIEHNTLCMQCWTRVDFIHTPICDVLGLPLPFATGEKTISAAALAAPPAYDRARAMTSYDGVSRELVHAVKYADRTDALAMLGRWLSLAARDFADEVDLVIPIPLNRWRLLSRRFNQAALLATALGRETGWPVAVDALRRIKRTRTQVGLTANQRRSNVSGAFRVQPRYQAEIRDRNILLVDDVLTTGATIDAAARTLRRAGARRVNVVTVARVVAPVVPTA